ncbi:hypothetical protein SDC9_151911 [bioreactor metagenome]|uniref:Uncharacterized protein n=1 Tax=bioreactor metagenome TaxID=1076179 RepID=A0A645ETB6_9ZZZZ
MDFIEAAEGFAELSDPGLFLRVCVFLRLSDSVLQLLLLLRNDSNLLLFFSDVVLQNHDLLLPVDEQQVLPSMCQTERSLSGFWGRLGTLHKHFFQFPQNRHRFVHSLAALGFREQLGAHIRIE